MAKNVTIGIYGIPDIDDTEYPSLIHDHNLSVIIDGELVTYIHLERITENKYDARLPRYIEAIIRKLKLTTQDSLRVFFVDHEIGRSFISTGGKIRFEGDIKYGLSEKPIRGRLRWFDRFAEGYTVSHELAHILSCIPFFGIFEENSIQIHYDGGASVSNFSVWQFRSGRLKPITFHYKLKDLTGLLNANALVFSMVGSNLKNQNSVPGKFMGLASYGTYSDELEKWLQSHNYFKNIWSSKKDFFKAATDFTGRNIMQIDTKDPFIQDIAATIHHIFIRDSLYEILPYFDNLDSHTLYFTGGCALSIKLNSEILKTGAVENLYIPPCTNDSGLSLGAVYANHTGAGNMIKQHNPYLNNFDREKSSGIKFSRYTIKNVCKILNEGGILAICNGNGEAGPRALGNRSILARPDKRYLAQRISRNIKGREWYRPVAPIMLKRNATYFTGLHKFPDPARYMLLDFDILPEKINEIEGCVHVDGTSRIQVIFEKAQNHFMFEILEYLEEEFKLRALINTSFNSKGTPIVHTNEQAVKTAKMMKLDALVLDGELMVLNQEYLIQISS